MEYPHRCFFTTLAVLNKIHSFVFLMARVRNRPKGKFTCQGSHEDHQILRIYKNGYKDGVCLDAMETYIDCSQIQSFKCNNLRILNRSPRCGSTLDDAVSCNNDSRKSKAAKAYPYCSITCMVKAARKSSIPPTVSIQAPPPPPPPHGSLGEISEPSKRKRKRKGIPHRAPLF
ncbi:hypothetical protein QL285_077619 [Trifolium repens]|nr:hypothetical protein QL285_077619 [Trifolium repens]